MFERYHRSIVSDEAVTAFYRALIDCGRERISYPRLPARSAGEYLRKVREDKDPWWLVTFAGRMAGCAYLTEIEGKCAQCHFAFLPNPPSVRAVKGVPFQVAMGRYILASVLHDRDQNGDYIVNTLVGVIALKNKGALRLGEKCGGVTLGVIPDGRFSHDNGGNEDCVISYYTRMTVPRKWTAEDNHERRRQ